MTQEEKAKRYDEAIERARALNNGEAVNIKIGTTTCEYIFPELKESEDERIRKELIDFVKSRLAGFPECGRFIAWLEKQGKHLENYDEAEKEKVDNQNCVKSTDKVEPKFNVGDKIQHKNGYSLDVSILKINADCYTVKDFMGDQITIDFTHQDNYELVPDKFDLNTLKPFESSVLVRNSKDQYWIPAFWGYKAKDGYATTFGHCNYCIPFEENEHLLGTTGNCSEFYKTWEEK